MAELNIDQQNIMHLVRRDPAAAAQALRALTSARHKEQRRMKEHLDKMALERRGLDIKEMGIKGELELGKEKIGLEERLGTRGLDIEEAYKNVLAEVSRGRLGIAEKELGLSEKRFGLDEKRFEFERARGLKEEGYPETLRGMAAEIGPKTESGAPRTPTARERGMIFSISGGGSGAYGARSRQRARKAKQMMARAGWYVV